jgi:hypothetical protein
MRTNQGHRKNDYVESRPCWQHHAMIPAEMGESSHSSCRCVDIEGAALSYLKGGASHLGQRGHSEGHRQLKAATVALEKEALRLAR